MRRTLRVVRWVALVLAILLLPIVGVFWWGLRASLPQLDGEQEIADLSHAVSVERDDLGVPTIRGNSRADVARATGFVHAQDRFFQMDLQRRYAAGELSELIGVAALRADRGTRLHRFRARARQALSRMNPSQRVLLEAYADGVNAGLAALNSRPFEYWFLRTKPRAWRPEDSLLVAFGMFLDLQETDGRRERSREALERVLPPELVEFFADNGSAWSARLDGTTDPVFPIPTGAVWTRYLALVDQLPDELAHAATSVAEATMFSPAKGSNNWAVSGARSLRGGGAIVANDMHLSLRNLPPIWYRARLVVDAPAEAMDVCGLTLPGVPMLAAGSNGHVAWGFTNAYADTADLVVIEPAGVDSREYRVPGGTRRIEQHVETIAVRGGAPESLLVEETIWGPVLPRDSNETDERRFALAWIAHDIDQVGFDCIAFERVTSVEAALAVASEAWFPAQNFVVGDRDGNIGWTVLGPVPRRVGFDGSRPVSMADGTRRWDGILRPEEHPRIVNPAEGVIWTANAEVVGGTAAALLGDGGYAIDGRAYQIRERLRVRDRFDELALLEIQKDSEVFFLRRWRELALRTLDASALDAHPRRAEFRRLLEEWSGAATPDSAGYPLLRDFRRRVADRVLGRLLLPCRRFYGGFSYRDFNYEEPLWLLVSEQPAAVAPPGGWRGELLNCIDGLLAERLDGGPPLAQQTWGRINYVDLAHPFARSLPATWRWLGMPREAMAGDGFAPNAFSRSHGPTERMVVSPGSESSGIMHMPGGQSGHPLSSFFRAGHAAWVRGEATPFLPGEARHRLTLLPSSGAR